MHVRHFSLLPSDSGCLVSLMPVSLVPQARKAWQPCRCLPGKRLACQTPFCWTTSMRRPSCTTFKCASNRASSTPVNESNASLTGDPWPSSFLRVSHFPNRLFLPARHWRGCGQRESVQEPGNTSPAVCLCSSHSPHFRNTGHLRLRTHPRLQRARDV
jgi:hypothetical protein